MPSSSYTLSVTAIAEWLASSLPDDQLDLLAALFTQLGDTLETIAAVRGLDN